MIKDFLPEFATIVFPRKKFPKTRIRYAKPFFSSSFKTRREAEKISQSEGGF